MKKIFLVLVAPIVLSCGKSAISKKLSGCDSLVITFNVPDSDSVINIINTTETKAIQKLARYLNGKPAANKECGFDGNMLFFKGGRQVLPVVFKYSADSCRYFLFDLDNKVVSTKMSNEAASFLKSLAEGRGWY